jgi:hypothetical protein
MRLRLLSAALLTLAACDSAANGTDEAPVALAASYRLATTIDLPASAALPADLAAALDLLRGLRDAPGETIFDLAGQAGVPAVDELRDALPGALESRVEGWVDDQVRAALAADPELAAALDLVVDAADTVLAEIHLASELSGGQHRLITIGFDVAGTAATFPVDGLPLTTVPASLQVTGGALAVGDHAFGLPVGDLAYRAFSAEVERRAGTDVRGVLADAIDCPAVAAAVADQCVLGACVGHEDDLLAVCAEGIDYLVAELAARFAEANLDVLRLERGSAPLLDADGDGIAEQLGAGTWAASIDVGAGLRPAPASFVGAAVGL